MQTFIVSNLPIVSRWFTESAVNPLRRLAYFNVTRSNHPHLLGRPVVVPYSCPSSRILSPVASRSSVTYGPSPTRLEYALMTPYTFPISEAERPVPVRMPPIVGFDDVTYGYEPKSMSRSVACAPSTTTFLSSSSALCKRVIVSHTYGSSCAA